MRALKSEDLLIGTFEFIEEKLRVFIIDHLVIFCSQKHYMSVWIHSGHMLFDIQFRKFHMDLLFNIPANQPKEAGKKALKT